jgi:hypothetical protein
MQRARVTLELQHQLVQAKREPEAYEVLQRFVQQFPDYPGRQDLYLHLIALAKQLGKTQAAEKYEREMNLPAPPRS